MITLELAKKMILAAETKATELGVAVSIAILDDHGTLLAFSRMDGAIKISPRFAVAKAYTSGSIGLPTSDIAGYATEGKPYYGITSVLGGDLTTIAGGLPIMMNGKLVGGIGVGGSTDVSQDAMCAQAGIETIV